MQASQPNLFTRPDTFFGICQGLGEDLRIHPNLFRLGLAILLYWNSTAAVAAYAGAGMLVLVTRLLFPDAQVDALEAASPESIATAEEEPVTANAEAEREPVPLAA